MRIFGERLGSNNKRHKVVRDLGVAASANEIAQENEEIEEVRAVGFELMSTNAPKLLEFFDKLFPPVIDGIIQEKQEWRGYRQDGLARSFGGFARGAFQLTLSERVVNAVFDGAENPQGQPIEPRIFKEISVYSIPNGQVGFEPVTRTDSLDRGQVAETANIDDRYPRVTVAPRDVSYVVKKCLGFTLVDGELKGQYSPYQVFGMSQPIELFDENSGIVASECEIPRDMELGWEFMMETLGRELDIVCGTTQAGDRE